MASVITLLVVSFENSTRVAFSVALAIASREVFSAVSFEVAFSVARAITLLLVAFAIFIVAVRGVSSAGGEAIGWSAQRDMSVWMEYKWGRAWGYGKRGRVGR